MSIRSSHILIVGGGVFGVSTAIELRRRGHDVTLLEPGATAPSHGDFWIDNDPERPGLLVSAGGSGHAFKFTPLIGGITADVLEGKPNCHAPRFAWRKRGELRAEEARSVSEGIRTKDRGFRRDLLFFAWG
ncbi:MAG: FAD-dependent oxidoreductase [Anaerolineales bacterium]